MKTSKTQKNELDFLLRDMVSRALNYNLNPKKAQKLMNNDSLYSMDLKEELLRVFISESKDGTYRGKLQEFTYPLVDLFRAWE